MTSETRLRAHALATARTALGAAIDSATCEYDRVSPYGMRCNASHTRC